MPSSKITSESKKVDVKLFYQLWILISPYKYKLALSIVILLLAKGITSLIPLGVKYGIDIINNAKDQLESITLIVGADSISLTDISIFLILMLFAQFITMYYQIYITNYFGQRIMRDLRHKLFSHTMNQSLSFFDKSKGGQLVTRVVYDVQTLNELLVTGLPTILGDSFLIISIFVIFFLLDVKLALVSLCLFPLLYIGMRIFKKYARKSFLLIRIKLSEMNGFLRSTIEGIKTVQVFNKENKVFRVFRRLHKKYFLEYLNTVKIFSIYFPAVESFSIVSRVSLIVFGGYWVYTGESALSNVIAFLLYSPIFFRPMRELSDQYNVLQAAMASSERIFSLLDTKEHIPESDNPIIKNDFEGELEFKNVSFSYNKSNPVLTNISFKIKKGEKVALVGLTGSGKSTIINLINRLYDIEHGEILIDGINIKNLSKNSLRNAISSVLQDVFIFSGTIKDNIRLFDSSITDDKLINSAKQAHSHSFIQRLSDKYDTELGERGVGLSFGQKQLLAFARALVHDSKIVIFDEATSNIDLQTERIIQQNIKELVKGRTAIIIAHRLSTIKHVDKIIVLHRGRIKEQGSHDELLKCKGLYRKLYNLQFRQDFLSTAS